VTAITWWLLAVAVVGVLLVLGVRACRAASGADWGHPVLNVLDGLNRIFCRRYHRLRHDPVPLPREGGALVVANHVSGVDPMLMIAAAPRPLRFMIAAEEYHRFGLNLLFRSIGCIPVERSTRPEKALRAAFRALAAGEVVAMFPEGGIRQPGAAPGPVKRGMLVLAARSGVPIVPLHVDGIAGAGLTVRAVFPRSHAVIRVGDPVSDIRGRDDPRVSEIARFIGARVEEHAADDAADPGEVPGDGGSAGPERTSAP
jgi:1-acyl-sn-glycerol-3-phosphate acyltransferase